MGVGWGQGEPRGDPEVIEARAARVGPGGCGEGREDAGLPRPREDSALRCEDAEKGAMVWLKFQQGALCLPPVTFERTISK